MVKSRSKEMAEKSVPKPLIMVGLVEGARVRAARQPMQLLAFHKIMFMLLTALSGQESSVAAGSNLNCKLEGQGGLPNRQPPFKEVVIAGDGFKAATLLQTTCFTIQAMDGFGKSMDDGCRQRTFFVVLLRSSTGVKLSADVEYEPATGQHKACYTLAVPGVVTISVQLVFTNYDLLTDPAPEARAELRKLKKKDHKANAKRTQFYVEGFHNYLVVARSSFSVNLPPDSASAQLARASLPRCTFELLRDSRNRGYWDHLAWHPIACRPFRLTPQDIAQCLHGKRILMIGDSQMRYNVAELMSFLKTEDRCRYLTSHARRQRWAASIRYVNVNSSQADLPINPGTSTVVKLVTNFERAGKLTFYGSSWNGFGRVWAKAYALGKGGRRSKLPSGSFSLTYVTHMTARDPVFQKWMADPTYVGDRGADRDAPFDYVLATTGLHDLRDIESAEAFGRALEEHFVPSLLRVVRDARDITWTGLWAAQESTKPPQYVPFSNNARGFVYEDTARSVLRRMNMTNWIDVRQMTLPRPDLCQDSTHYSWPVSIATIELWLGSICRPLQGREDDDWSDCRKRS